KRHHKFGNAKLAWHLALEAHEREVALRNQTGGSGAREANSKALYEMRAVSDLLQSADMSVPLYRQWHDELERRLAGQESPTPRTDESPSPKSSWTIVQEILSLIAANHVDEAVALCERRAEEEEKSGGRDKASKFYDEAINAIRIRHNEAKGRPEETNLLGRGRSHIERLQQKLLGYEPEDRVAAPIPHPVQKARQPRQEPSVRLVAAGGRGGSATLGDLLAGRLRKMGFNVAEAPAENTNPPALKVDHPEFLLLSEEEFLARINLRAMRLVRRFGILIDVKAVFQKRGGPAAYFGPDNTPYLDHVADVHQWIKDANDLITRASGAGELLREAAEIFYATLKKLDDLILCGPREADAYIRFCQGRVLEAIGLMDLAAAAFEEEAFIWGEEGQPHQQRLAEASLADLRRRRGGNAGADIISEGALMELTQAAGSITAAMEARTHPVAVKQSLHPGVHPLWGNPRGTSHTGLRFAARSFAR
ncbi:MAG: hypothetical protein Q7T11_07025, partial [Deltaproteobacteria bacterium]|nr:hypothetical protein [Deltaproteobacteria bacterium]